jgi:Integrin alpha
MSGKLTNKLFTFQNNDKLLLFRQKVPNFVIGSAESINLKVTLTNTGDPSFNTKLLITLPSVPVNMPRSCQDVTNGTETVHYLECDAGNPLKANTKRDFVFLVNMGTSNINVQASLTSATPFANPNTASSSLALPLLTHADVTVYGYNLIKLQNQ